MLSLRMASLLPTIWSFLYWILSSSISHGCHETISTVITPIKLTRFIILLPRPWRACNETEYGELCRMKRPSKKIFSFTRWNSTNKNP